MFTMAILNQCGLILSLFCIVQLSSSANHKRLLTDDENFVSSRFNQIDTEIQNLKATLAEKDVHFMQLQNVVHGLTDRLTQKDTEIANLQNSVNEKSNQITNLTNELSSTRNRVKTLEDSKTTVAFYAYRQGNLPLNTIQTHRTVIYDQVDLNLGNGYSESTGKFTAPMDGTYVFHVATGANDNSHASVELVVNDIIRDISWADSMDHLDRSFATTATPVSMNKGDVALARIGVAHGGNVLESDVNMRCSFSGFKLD